ncbi:transposase [Nanoarchaeota archaeon]
MNKLKEIFRVNWKSYLQQNNNLRDVEKHEINKFLNCSKSSCNSRVCTSCGKRYADNLSNSLKVFDVAHLHITLTVSSLLWPFIKDKHLKIFMDCAIIAIKRYYNRDVTPGCIVFLHTFGRDLGYKPHLHVLATKGGFKNGKFILINRLPKYKKLGFLWRNVMINSFDFEDIGISRILFDQFRTKITVIRDKKRLLRYVLRYSRHPPIANSRIVQSIGGFVYSYYISHRTRKRVNVVQTADKFMKLLVQHIPMTQFKISRHYGAYSRNQKGLYSSSLN